MIARGLEGIERRFVKDVFLWIGELCVGAGKLVLVGLVGLVLWGRAAGCYIGDRFVCVYNDWTLGFGVGTNDLDCEDKGGIISEESTGGEHFDSALCIY